jgi:hypothetical protein
VTPSLTAACPASRAYLAIKQASLTPAMSILEVSGIALFMAAYLLKLGCPDVA